MDQFSKMTSSLLYFLSILAFVAIVQSRGDIHEGSSYGAKLIYHELHEKGAIPFVKRDCEVEVKTAGNEAIKAILVSDLKGNGESYIKRGGLRKKNVTIKIKGPRGDGYKFLIEVYAL